MSISKIFFGNPPPLAQLPDGRCIIDCQGFAALSTSLFEMMYPKQDANHFCIPLDCPNHEMALMKIDDQVFVVDNDSITPLEVSKEEIDYLESTYKSAKNLVSKKVCFF